METLPFLLVIISTFTHAYWNYLFKTSNQKHIFAALVKWVEVTIYFGPFIYYKSSVSIPPNFTMYIIVASAITFCYYFFLSQAYRYGELTIAYPLSRSYMLFLPILAYIFIGERFDYIGIISICLIIIGSLLLHFTGFHRSGLTDMFKEFIQPGTIFGLLAALSAAGITLWDKIVLKNTDPFIYFYLYTCLITFFYSMYVTIAYPFYKILNEFKAHRSEILQTGLLDSFTYLLVLTALSLSKATYVGGLRQLSVVIGAYFGIRFLNESSNLYKMIGITFLIFGASLIYFAK